ncbi:C-type lectin domain family 4 member E-like isoform X4 [Xiphophorus couchianus]|uniref:C-type lectin domain family 4 member E-like isoform X4 n=1 Tax=Xiphophorus couchianus TaxID=32473 RepID=UPI001015FAFF|nr:C-type lectin domain family 4 member E-like isoform X4 [Xiphophorus couchianus]
MFDDVQHAGFYNNQTDRNRTGENPSRTSKLPAGGVVLLVLVGLLAAAVIVIYRLSFDKIRTNQILQTLKEENEALRRNLSVGSTTSTTIFPAVKRETFLKCEAGWEKHGGSCYYFNTNKSSWNDSRRSCVDLGSDLVKIDSREEQMFLVGRLRDLMEDDEDMFWIGLTDLKEEGRWFWVDGSPLDESLTFWNDGEPDNRSKDGAGSADCGRMGRKREYENLKSWFDISCNYPHKSICEKTAGLSSCVCV